METRAIVGIGLIVALALAGLLHVAASGMMTDVPATPAAAPEPEAKPQTTP